MNGWGCSILVLIACCVVPMRTHAEGLTQGQATAFARLALAGIGREYPNKPADVLEGPVDVRPTREVHPAFYGCYDWHSAVHGHWMLVRLLRRFPGMPLEAEVRAAVAANLTAGNLQAEARSFLRPEAKSFERPYGWAWLLKLAEELHDWDDPQGRQWLDNLQPLVDVIVSRALDYFPKQTYPTRSGVHSNTAFGLAFALDYARAVGHRELEALLVERSTAFFGTDERLPVAWEPGGADFFSPSLMEADLMQRVLSAAAFREWLAGPSRRGGRGTGEPHDAGRRHRPRRSADRPPRRPQHQPRVVHAADRGGVSDGGSDPQGARRGGCGPCGCGRAPRHQRRLRRRALAGLLRHLSPDRPDRQIAGDQSACERMARLACSSRSGQRKVGAVAGS